MDELYNPLWLQKLNARLTHFLQGKVFGFLFALTILCVALAQWVQFFKTLTAPSVEGVAILAFFLLVYNSFIAMLYGILKKDVRIVIGMGIATCGALGTVITAIVRGGSMF